jgi:hypothetical protein
MSVLERAISAFVNRPVEQMTVPEWTDEAGQPTVIHYKTPNASVVSNVTRKAKDPVERAAMMVIAMATDADGERMFKDGDLHDFMTTVDPFVVSRIAAAILRNAVVDPESAEKN